MSTQLNAFTNLDLLLYGGFGAPQLIFSQRCSLKGMLMDTCDSHERGVKAINEDRERGSKMFLLRIVLSFQATIYLSYENIFPTSKAWHFFL